MVNDGSSLCLKQERLIPTNIERETQRKQKDNIFVFILVLNEWLVQRNLNLNVNAVLLNALAERNYAIIKINRRANRYCIVPQKEATTTLNDLLFLCNKLILQLNTETVMLSASTISYSVSVACFGAVRMLQCKLNELVLPVEKKTLLQLLLPILSR